VATEEVGLKLTLKGRREVAKGLDDTADKARKVGDETQSAGRKALVASRGLAAAADKKITRGFASMGRAARGAARALGRGLARGAQAGAVALGVAAVAAGAMSVKAIQLASDADETGSAFKTVLGPAARGVQGDLDRLSKRFGIYGSDLQQAATGFATLGKQAGKSKKDLRGFSTDLVQAGLDLGSFYNASPEDAFAAIQSGLTGEAESLKRFNIFMSDAALNAFAAAEGIGKTTQEMTDQEKIALRQAFILANLGDAQGDLARTSQGLANQQRGIQGRSKELMRMWGDGLTPAATILARQVNRGLTTSLSFLEPRMEAITKRASRMATSVAKAAKQLPNLWGAMKARDTQGVAEVLDNMLGNTGARVAPIRNSLDTVIAKVQEVRAIGSAVWEGIQSVPVSPLKILNQVLGFAARNLGVVKVAAMVILPIWAAYRVTLLATAAATRVYRLGQQAAMVATKTFTVATKALNVVMRANPIGLVITALTLLAGGVVLAYKKSDTFRGIVNKLWGALKVAGDWVKRTGAAVGTWIVDKFQAGKDKVDSIAGAVGRFVDKIRDAIGWVRDLGEKLSNMPGAGFLGGIAGGIGGLIPGRAAGGPVTAGKPYIVGERRAELFVPKVDGMIQPEVPRFRDWDDDDSAAAAAGPRQPVVIQNVIDGKVVGEVTVGYLQGRLARA
jgi:hypothetical protein